MVFENLLTDPVLISYVIFFVTLWTIPWKGVALWIAARKRHKIWFIVLLIVNTLAILEILYIFVFSKCGKKKAKERR